jgi:hypothetical protein
MKSLAHLKTRLETLPELRKGIEQAGLFAHFLKKVELVKQQLIEASEAAACSAPVLPSPQHDAALRSVRSSARIANNLAEKIRRDANTISDRGTEESFVKLTENSREALKRAKLGWQSELQSRIEKWETIAGVVSALGQQTQAIKAQAGQLKRSVDLLSQAKEKLPCSQSDAANVKSHLEQLAESVSQLGLDTPFGKFLQAAASEQGAPLSEMENEAVAEKIKSLKLDKVFRVRLSS